MASSAGTDLATLIAAASRLLAACTPSNLAAERQRLEAEAARGRYAMPAFTYVAEPGAAASMAWAAGLSVHSDAERPPDALLAERMEEIRLEGAIAKASGTPALSALAVARFGGPDAAADALAERWREDGSAPPSPASPASRASPAAPRDCSTDGPEPSSLASALRRRIFEERLDFRVAAHPELLALAATGADCIYVATGRLLSGEDVRRTVVHEIEGHAMPRTRARRIGDPLLALGTRGGHDDQEGFALFCEERAGCLTPDRRGELSLRHRAVARMVAGATFAETTRWLAVEEGRTPAQAVRLAVRIFRGSDGTFPGLGRERVYLAAFLRVRAHLEEYPADEAVLGAGQVSLAAVPALREIAFASSPSAATGIARKR